MSVKVSGCYYHPDKGAVATCAQCGRGVCSRCAVEDDETGRIICYQCANTKINQEQEEYRKLLKETGGRFNKGRDFIRPIIWGIIVFITLGLLIYLRFGVFFLTYFSSGDIVEGVMDGWVIFWIPFGLIWLNDVFPKKYTNTGLPSVRFSFELLFSLLFGWILFTFYLIRFIVIKITKKG